MRDSQSSSYDTRRIRIPLFLDGVCGVTEPLDLARPKTAPAGVPSSNGCGDDGRGGSEGGHFDVAIYAADSRRLSISRYR